MSKKLPRQTPSRLPTPDYVRNAPPLAHTATGKHEVLTLRCNSIRPVSELVNKCKSCGPKQRTRRAGGDSAISVPATPVFSTVRDKAVPIAANPGMVDNRDVELRDRITADPEILVGKPVIAGTRISVEFIVDLLASGWSHERILSNYPRLTDLDILACLQYAGELLHGERVYPVSVA